MILSKIAITPLLYLCGALLVALIGTSVYASVLGGKMDAAAQAATDKDDAHSAKLAAAHTERDAWKQRTADTAAAVNAHRSALVTMQGELERAQGETKRIDAAARRSIADAHAAALDADRTLAKMAAQFQTQARDPDCAQALAAMASACPALGGY